MSLELKVFFLHLVRLGISHTDVAVIKDNIDWVALKSLAESQGLSAVVLDGLNTLHGSGAIVHNSMPQEMRLEWIGEVLQNYEARYKAYEKAISSLARWHNRNGYKMMVLKGYACAMNWPNPAHRPCGDIDIWQFGEQKSADAALLNLNDNHNEKLESLIGEKSSKYFSGNPISIDSSHHHHTVFRWQGFTVENHYDFLNVHHHRSNREMEGILKELGKDDSNTIMVCGETVFLPSANLHALFLLRHSMSNFASTGFQLRQLLDWGFFVEKHKTEVDWEWLERQLENFGMKRLYNVFNAICVWDLGFDESIFPIVQFESELKARVLNDILSPEFSEKETGGFFSRAAFKYRRWKANAWKHELCFRESMWSAFWSGVKGHLIKPSMI